MNNEQQFGFSLEPEPESEEKRRSLLGWWYHLSAPEKRLESMSEVEFSRCQLASILLLIIFIALIAFLPAALTSDGLHVLPPLLGMFIVTCVAVFLNRQGKVTFVGILIVVAFDLALAEALLSYPHFVLTQNAVPIYDMFVLSDIIAISLLPGKSIFFVSFFHSAFMLADIILQPHTPDLQLLIDQTTYSFMVRPLAIQIVVALVTFLWVRNTMKALERANKAEIIVQLEQTIVQERKDLAEGVQQILYTLVEAANGNLNVRAPLVQQSALWQVGVGLNTLLARLQRAGYKEREYQRLVLELQRLLMAVQEAKSTKMPLSQTPGGTELDLLINELLNTTISPPPQMGMW